MIIDYNWPMWNHSVSLTFFRGVKFYRSWKDFWKKRFQDRIVEIFFRARDGIMLSCADFFLPSLFHTRDRLLIFLEILIVL